MQQRHGQDAAVRTSPRKLINALRYLLYGLITTFDLTRPRCGCTILFMPTDLQINNRQLQALRHQAKTPAAIVTF